MVIDVHLLFCAAHVLPVIAVLASTVFGLACADLLGCLDTLYQCSTVDEFQLLQLLRLGLLLYRRHQRRHVFLHVLKPLTRLIESSCG